METERSGLESSLSKREEVLLRKASEHIVLTILKERIFSADKGQIGFIERYRKFLKNLLNPRSESITQEGPREFYIFLQIQKNIKEEDPYKDVIFVITPPEESKEVPSKSRFVSLDEVLDIYKNKNYLPEDSDEIFNAFVSATHSSLSFDTEKSIANEG